MFTRGIAPRAKVDAGFAGQRRTGETRPRPFDRFERSSLMADPRIEEAKAALRLRARAMRAGILNSTRPGAAKAVADHFFRTVQLRPADVVAGYWRIKDEMDCQPILIRLMDSLQPVCLPVVLGDDQPLELRLWEQGTPLYEAGFGTLAPSELAPQVEPDVVIMPLLGFDSRGTRLGYGGGYYDRTLERLTRRPRLVGIAFAAQELDAIPHEPHDFPLDVIVTEQGARSFERATA
jgi:5-formyltetrahydrofolate cyclo-ligase